MRFLKQSSLSLFFLALMLLSVVFQAIVGHDLYNDEEQSHAALNNEQPQLISFGRYLFSSHFGQSLMENWQSEYLQFSLMISPPSGCFSEGQPSRRRSAGRAPEVISSR